MRLWACSGILSNISFRNQIFSFAIDPWGIAIITNDCLVWYKVSKNILNDLLNDDLTFCRSSGKSYLEEIV